MAQGIPFGKRTTAPAGYGAAPATPMRKWKWPQAKPSPLADLQSRYAIPYLSVTLILFLSFYYVVQLSQGYAADSKIAVSLLWVQGGLNREAVFGQGQWWRMISAPLLHSSTVHLAGNCFALLLIGIFLEKKIGRIWFAATFFLGMIGGSIGSLVGNASQVVSVGASGAILALCMLGYCLQFASRDFKQQRWRNYFYMQMAIMPLVPRIGTPSNIDWGAHIGGAITGYLIFMLFERKWDLAVPHPPFRNQARIGVAAGFILVIANFGVIANSIVPHMQYLAGLQGKPDVIPPAIFPRSREQGEDMSLHLAEAFPKDPLAHYFRARQFTSRKEYPDAEKEIAAALALFGGTTGKRPSRELDMRGDFAIWMAAWNPARAKIVAAPLCGARDKKAAPHVWEKGLC